MLEIKGKYTNAIVYARSYEEEALSQVYGVVNSKAMEGQRVRLMPDMHVGKEGPIGLTLTVGNYVNPSFVGVDIGCSVSMMKLNGKLKKEDYVEFEHKVKQKVPFGFTLHDHPIIDEKDFFRFMTSGVNGLKQKWIEMLEDLPSKVDERYISEMLKRIGMDEGVFYKSLGTVGGGNHFVEYDENEKEGGVGAICLHFGSRNFGVKVCNYWVNRAKKGLSSKERKLMMEDFKKDYLKTHSSMKNFKEDWNHWFEKNGMEGRVEGYLTGEDMKGYLRDMCICQLYAKYNHLMVQKIIKDILLKYGLKPTETIISTHNYIDLEDHILRKSAIRAYKNELLLVPFSMKDGVMVGEGMGNEEWNYSCCHGAGRKMSRTKAKQTLTMDEFRKEMESVYSTTVCEGTLDESPMAYKDTYEILNIIYPATCKIKEWYQPKINIKGVE